jgi:hypothetical protein
MGLASAPRREQDSAIGTHAPASDTTVRHMLQRTATFACLLLTLLFASAPAGAQSASPTGSPPPGVRLSGSVTGSLKKGGVVRFRLRVIEAGGFRNLQLFKVTMLLHDLVLSEFTYLRDPNDIAVRGSQLIGVGTPGVLDGAFFRFRGLDVITTSAGNTFDLSIRSQVLQDVPPGTDFQFTAVNQDNSSVSIIRHLNIEEAGPTGFSWGTLAVAVVGALFAGSFLGGVFASRRRPKPRPSIYGTVQRRLEEERVKS